MTEDENENAKTDQQQSPKSETVSVVLGWLAMISGLGAIAALSLWL